MANMCGYVKLLMLFVSSFWGKAEVEMLLDFVEGCDIDRLYQVFMVCDLLLKEVCADLQTQA